MIAEQVVTKSKIAADLRELGLGPGDTVISHESVKAVGWIVGGPDVVIEAILDVIGPQGTLLKYVGSEDGTYSLASWPEEVQRAYLEECPGFDPERTRAHRKWGILTEYLRTWPGAHRSCHPDSSFVAVGRLAAWLTAEHPLRYGFGPGSPMARLVEAKGKVLMMGCPLAHMTLIHHSEHIADVQGKRVVNYKMPIVKNGERVWVEIEEFDTGTGIVDWPHGEDYFETIVKSYLASGAGREGHVGYAKSCLINADNMHKFAIKWMEKEFQ